MKKSLVLVLSLLLASVGMTVGVRDAFAIDPPHNGQNSPTMTMTCSSCHYDTTSVPSWATQQTTTDATFYNNMCTSCHNPSTLSDSSYVVKTHSSTNISGKYGVWTIECRQCHNPHYQDQVTSHPTDSDINLLTSTVSATCVQSAVTALESSISVNGGLTPDAWIDFVLVPNTAYATKMYRIKTNTANTITVFGPINCRYVAYNGSYGIRNGKLVAAQIQTPNSGLATVKYYTKDSSKPDSYASSTDPGNVTGICQVCHTQTQSFNRTNVTGSIQEGPNHPSVIASGQQCTQCHIHNEGFKGECNSCHGYPPDSTATLVFKNKSGVTVTSDSGAGPGAHVVHVNSVKLVCSVCHANGMLSGASQGDDLINIGFDWNGDTSGSYDGKSGRLVFPYSPNVTQNNTYKCSNIYCHSSGQGTTSLSATPVYAQPVWNNPASAACGACHKTTTGTALGQIDTGSHTPHLNSTVAIQCGDCHTGAGNGTSYDSANHVNRSIDVADGYTAAGTAGNGYGTCNVAACHGSKSPEWGTNFTGIDSCTRCHGTPTAAPAPDYDKAPPTDLSGSTTGAKVGAHQAHLTSNSIGRTLSCNECHVVPATVDAAGHIMDATPGVAEVTFASSTVANTNGATPSYAAGSCATTYCHGSKMPKGTTEGANITPSWGDTTYFTGTASHDCAQCHGYPPSTIGAHSGKGPTDCHSCHSDVNASGTGFDQPYMHINGSLDVTGCNGCHGQSGTTGAPLIAADLLTGPSYSPTGHTVGMHPMHVTTRGYSCDVCHDNSLMPSIDSQITISFNLAAAGLSGGGTYTGYTLNPPYSYRPGSISTSGPQSCSNLYCHGATLKPDGGLVSSPVWTDASTGACGSCHGATAANPPTRGSHVKHAASYQIACSTCHVNNATQHVDGLSEVAFDPAEPRANGGSYSGTPAVLDAYGSCSNLYCHSPGTAFTTPYTVPATTPTWGNNTLTCDSCHGGTASGPNYPNGYPKANSHQAHVVNNNFHCDKCHNATTTDGTSITSPANHVNRQYDLAPGTGVNFTVAVQGNPTTPTQCSSISCHGGNSATWGSTVKCSDCHFGTNDVDDYTYSGGTGTTALVSQTEWNYSGHGRPAASGNYDQMSNPPADFGAAAGGSGDQCLYCHDGSVSHGAATNFFRLRSYGTATWGVNTPCLICHATGAPGIAAGVVGTGSLAKTASRKIDKDHFGANHSAALSGGQLCWDCHDPHGDRTATNNGPIAMIQLHPASASSTADGRPTTITTVAVSFTNTAAGSDFGKTATPFNGVCNVCHTYKAADPNKMTHYTSTYSDSHNSTLVCTTCHKHSADTTYNGDAFKGGGCNGCHGYPPRTGDGKGYMLVNGNPPAAQEGKGGYDLVGDGGHTTHVSYLATMYSLTTDPNVDQFGDAKTTILCGTCHDMTLSNHSTDGNGTRNITFTSATTSLQFGGSAPKYNGVPGVSSSTTPKTCSNLSCHFQATPVWQDPATAGQ